MATRLGPESSAIRINETDICIYVCTLIMLSKDYVGNKG